MTDNFCSSCTRLRLTADGHLKACLHDYAEVDLYSTIHKLPDRGVQSDALLRWMSSGDNRPSAEIIQLIDRLDELVNKALLQKKREHAGEISVL